MADDGDVINSWSSKFGGFEVRMVKRPSDLWSTKDPLRRLLRRLMDGSSYYPPSSHLILGRNIEQFVGLASIEATEEEWDALMKYIWPSEGEDS